MLKEIELSDGKKVRVIEVGGYHDGYYWDMTATVEIDGIEYTVQDAGSFSGYYPIYNSVSVNGPCKLTGAELEKIEGPSDNNISTSDWDYFSYTIKDHVEYFFALGAKESYEYCEGDGFNPSTHVDGVKVSVEEDEK